MRRTKKEMNCLCNILDNDIIWIILIALLVSNLCNSSSCGCGCPSPCNTCGDRDCGCYRG